MEGTILVEQLCPPLGQRPRCLFRHFADFLRPLSGCARARASSPSAAHTAKPCRAPRRAPASMAAFKAQRLGLIGDVVDDADLSAIDFHRAHGFLHRPTAFKLACFAADSAMPVWWTLACFRAFLCRSEGRHLPHRGRGFFPRSPLCSLVAWLMLWAVALTLPKRWRAHPVRRRPLRRSTCEELWRPSASRP